MIIKNPAFIFVRGGSKGIKNKNIQKLNKKPLIAHAIEFAINYKKFEKIYVSTDSDKIIDIISHYPQIELIKRPKFLATDHSPEILSWKHALKYLNKKNIFFENMTVLPATSPFRMKKDLDTALKLINKKVDLVVSMSKARKYPNFNMLKKSGNYLVLYKKNTKYIHRRQDAHSVFDMTTLFYLIKTDYLIKTKYLLSGKILGVEIPKNRSIDIDDYDDLNYANYLYKNGNIDKILK